MRQLMSEYAAILFLGSGLEVYDDECVGIWHNAAKRAATRRPWKASEADKYLVWRSYDCGPQIRPLLIRDIG
jgi:hypothetical protein